MSNDRVKKDCIGDTQRPPVVLQPRLIAWGLVPFGPSHCHPPSHCSLCPGHGQHTPIHRRFLVTVPSCVQSGGLLEDSQLHTTQSQSRHCLCLIQYPNCWTSVSVTVCAGRVPVGPCQACWLVHGTSPGRLVDSFKVHVRVPDVRVTVIFRMRTVHPRWR
jgi:hypothetical protein